MSQYTPSLSNTPLWHLRTALLCATMAGGIATGSLAQERSEAPVVAVAASQAMPAAPAVQPGRTRAEVIAELECARASGELKAMVLRSYGQPTPPLRPEACAPGAMAGSAPGLIPYFYFQCKFYMEHKIWFQILLRHLPKLYFDY